MNEEIFNYDKNLEDAIYNIISLVFNNIVRNKNSTLCGGIGIRRSGLCINVISKPKFVYHEVKGCLVAYDEKTGFLHYFQNKPYDNKGFGGRAIELNIKGGKVFKKLGITKKTFNGTLWDTANARKVCEEYFNIEAQRVGIRQQHDRLQVFSSVLINKKVMDIKMEIAGISLIKER